MTPQSKAPPTLGEVALAHVARHCSVTHRDRDHVNIKMAADCWQEILAALITITAYDIANHRGQRGTYP